MSQNKNTLVAWSATCTGAKDLLASFPGVSTVPYKKNSKKQLYSVSY